MIKQEHFIHFSPSSSRPFVPVSNMSDQVTKDWVKSVILKSNRGYVRNSSDIRICSLESVRALPKGENYMTVPLRVTVVYENEDYEEKRLDLFAKVAPTGSEHRMFAESVGAFLREALVYGELLPAMRRNVDEVGAAKTCYPDAPVSVYVKGTGDDMVIVMENLEILGYRMANRFTGASEVETRMVLRSFAKFHANGIALALKMGDSFTTGDNSFKELHSDPFDNDFIRAAFSDNTMFHTMQQALAKVPGQEGNAARLKAYLDTPQGTGSMTARFSEVAKFQGHPKLLGYKLGDCWLNNMMFRDEVQEDGTTKPAAIRLLDYQIVQAGAPFPDLHYFFGSSVTNEVLSKRKQLLEEEYYPELFRILELLQAPFTSAEYPFEKFWEEFLANSEFCLLSAMFILPIVMARKEEIPDYDTGDLNLDDFKTMTKDVVNSNESAKVMGRFAHVVQVMIDSNVI